MDATGSGCAEQAIRRMAMPYALAFPPPWLYMGNVKRLSRYFPKPSERLSAPGVRAQNERGAAILIDIGGPEAPVERILADDAFATSLRLEGLRERVSQFLKAVLRCELDEKDPKQREKILDRLTQDGATET